MAVVHQGGGLTGKQTVLEDEDSGVTPSKENGARGGGKEKGLEETQG